MSVQVIDKTSIAVVRQPTQTVKAYKITHSVRVASAGVQGIQGPIGPDTTSINRVAATNLSGHRAVATNSSGQFVYADNSIPEHAQSTIGITTGAASQGADANAIAIGPLTEPSWTWTPQQLIFVGSNGQLTQVAPTSGFVLAIARAVTATTIFVCLQPAINRS